MSYMDMMGHSVVFGVLDVKFCFFFSTIYVSSFFYSLIEYFDNAKQIAKKYFYIRYFTVRSQESQSLET